MGNEEKKEASEQIGTLGGCLIEGDSEQKARERKVKRRALTISIGLQSAALVALLVTPLLAKPEKLPSTMMFVPMPPYHVVREQPPARRPVSQPPQRTTGFVAPTNIPPRIAMRDDPHPQSPTTTDDGFNLNNAVPTSGPIGATELFRGNNGPTPPHETSGNDKKRITVGGGVQQAMLIHRVEPSYPPIAKTLHKSGQVHIKAIIATDGSIESLQVLDGDPLLVRSALDAVGQWRYRPTLLNGSPVEVETVVTVIYTLNQ